MKFVCEGVILSEAAFVEEKLARRKRVRPYWNVLKLKRKTTV